jgi:hypothetical protein
MKAGAIALQLVLFTLAYACPHTQAAGVDNYSYEQVLRANVRNGLVHYIAVSANMDHLSGYIQSIVSLEAREYERWSREEKMAFWINTYNAITIFGVIKNYPIEPGRFLDRWRFPHNSIRQIHDFWDTSFVNIMGHEIALNQLENDSLRAKFGDPRIHFSIARASIGGPLLSSDIYRGVSLDNQLENDAWRFVNNSEKVRVDKEKNRIYVSAIFDWYKEDFPAKDGSEWLESYKKNQRGFMEFIVRYIDHATRDYIITNRPQVKFLDYDWTLNEEERVRR